MSSKSSSIPTAATAAVAVGLLGSLLWIKLRRDKSRQEVGESSIGPEETLVLIRKRRSIFGKQFTGEQVPQSVLDDMLEAARWAPSHHLTESWHFVIYSSLEGRTKVGKYLAENYKRSSEKTGQFSQAKYDKKELDPSKSSYVIALCCKTNKKSRVMEEICALSCAIQNMHLVATSHNVGAYWSSSGVYANKESLLENPNELLEFLELPKDNFVCIGWMFVGDYKKEWPTSRRKPCSHTIH